MKNTARPRSRRLRKKLHAGEFQQMGFDVQFVFRQGLNDDQNDQFWDSFIADAIEANGLTYGGSNSGFVVPAGRVSATESHRLIVQSWLLSRPGLETVEVGQLEDAWHSYPAGC